MSLATAIRNRQQSSRVPHTDEMRLPGLALTIRNRQKTRAVNLRLLRRIVTTLLNDLLQIQHAELGIVVVAAPEITHLNETFLRHAGPTDVIAFDYSTAANTSPSPIEWERVEVRISQDNSPRLEPLSRRSDRSAEHHLGQLKTGLPHEPRRCSALRVIARALRGEVFICMDEALLQARRYRTSWQAELVRYIVHGVLHLCGFDDHCTPDRRRMKRAEDRLLRQLAARFPLSRLARKTKLRP